MGVAGWWSGGEFVLGGEDLAGPVNLVGPEPVTNATFTQALARLLHRPAVLQVPGLALQVVLGEFAHEALRSQRVLPGVLQRAGFTFTQPTLEEALRAAVDQESSTAGQS